jgi:hypothetical protein
MDGVVPYTRSNTEELLISEQTQIYMHRMNPNHILPSTRKVSIAGLYIW